MVTNWSRDGPKLPGFKQMRQTKKVKNPLNDAGFRTSDYLLDEW